MKMPKTQENLYFHLEVSFLLSSLILLGNHFQSDFSVNQQNIKILKQIHKI